MIQWKFLVLSAAGEQKDYQDKIVNNLLVFFLSVVYACTYSAAWAISSEEVVGLYDGFVGLGMNAKPRVTYTCSFVLLPSLLMY